MKSIYSIMLVAIALLSLASCNDEWDKELYKNTISFAQNDLYDVHIRYQEGGKTTYELPLVVSGTKDNTKEYHVKVGVDIDTLDIMNFERFRNRTDLYYEYLDDQYWSLPSFEVTIPSGENTATLDIDFSLDNLNLSRKWVLPLTVLDDPTYEANHRKYYRKALLHIVPFNDYSGSYNGSAVTVTNRDTNEKQTLDNRTIFVVNDTACFLYAGVTDEELENRETYKVNLTFVTTSTYEQDGKTITEGKLLLSASNGDKIGFKAGDNNSFRIETSMDAVQLYLQRKAITLNLSYDYDELIPNTTSRIHYHVQGMMGMERKRNITIPDENQATYW